MSVQNITKAMLSLAFRTKFKNVTALILKTEAVNNLPFISLHRTICTSRILKSRNPRRKLSFSELNAHEEYIAGRDPKEFGKTVILNPEEVEEDNEDVDIENFKNSRFNKKRKGFQSFGEKRAEKIDKSVTGSFAEVEDDNNYDDDDNFRQSKFKRNKKNFKFEKKLKQSLSTDLDDLDDDHGGKKINFTTLKPKSVLFSSVMSNLKSRKKREKLNKVLIEGRKLIREAVAAGCEPEMIFFSRIEDVKDFNLPQSTKLYKVSYKDIQLWSGVETSQGIIGVFQLPNLSFQKNNSSPLPLTVICDNIRDPGNMGSILRVATSVGCRKIILTKGCVDIWSLKVTRAAAGAHFLLPILESLTWPEIANEVVEGSKILLATNLKRIPEDLNYESPGAIPATNDQLPILSYFSQNYCNENLVIIIGNESHGISKEALQFAKERKGIKVYIPMSNNMESLNSGVAFAILSYEMRRQIENAAKNESQEDDSGKESNDFQESSSVQSN